MKRIFYLAAVVLSSLMLFSACIRPPVIVDTDEYDVNLDLDKNIEETISILVPGGNANETSMIEKAIEAFNLVYPNVTVEINFVAINSYENTVRSLAAAEALDDIIWSNSPDFYYLVSRNLALNLNKYIEESEKAGVFDMDEDFLTEYFDMGKVDDKQYVIPRSADSVVTFYNKNILQAAGVDQEVLKNGWSWDEFMDACQKVREYFDANGMSTRYVLDANLTTWLSVNYPMLRSFGADVADSEGNIVIDSPETMECLELVRSLVEKRYIVPSLESSGSSFEAGTSAFLFQSSAVSHFAERKELKGNIDIVSFPLILNNDTPKIGSGIAGYTLSALSNKKDVAWAFLNFLMSYDGQQALALGGLNLPSIRMDLQNYYEANWGKDYSDFNLEAYLYGGEYKTTAEFLMYFDPTYKFDIDQAVKDLFNNACNINKTLEESMQTVIRDLNNAISA